MTRGADAARTGVTASPLRVVRYDVWNHPDMVERFARESDIEFVALPSDDDGAVWTALADAHVYQISSAKDELPPAWHATATVLERTPRLLCVSTSGAGYDTVDVADCTAAGVLVVNQSGANARSVAEHTLAMILDLAKRVSESDRLLRTTRGYSREDLTGREIAGRTLGLVGIGNIGRRVAPLAHAFGMSVLAADPYLDDDEVARRGAEKVDLDELLRRSDVVSLHCPRDRSTLGMMDEAAFAKMKPGAVFITTSRGGIHDEAALTAALTSGHLGGAGIDVWDVEPPPLDHPLLARDNVVATYHTAGVTHESRAAMAQYASDQIVDVLRGRRPPRLVNPEAWQTYRSRFERIMGFAPDGGDD